MESKKADVVICGAGIAGISAAYFLSVHRGIRDILLVDERPPLTLTSDKSTECYRNWWPGPGDTMVRFMNQSIDLLEQLAEESDNYFHMNRRGYVFLTADPDRALQMRRAAEEIGRMGAGPLRLHQGLSEDPSYPMCDPQTSDSKLNGSDLVLDPEVIRKQYPFISDTALAMLHVRRCGWLSAQQLGMYLIDRAKERGTRLLKGRLTGVSTRADRIESVQVETDGGPIEVATRTFIIAAGPFLKQAGAMIGIDFPVVNELHGKIAFNDPKGIISRDAPLMIWQDPVAPYWSQEEREELEAREETRWLTKEFPAGVHFRPEGGPGSSTILALWTYDLQVREPVWPLVFEPNYAEIVLRGLVRMIPGLSVYLGRISPPAVDGGYYCKTQENRPIIGPLPVEGAYVIGAMSGFGIMAGMAAGELVATHVAGGRLPAYAPDFLLSRYEDPVYRKLLENWDSTSGQL
ncbi:MAG: FAD-binding oxidoreductase [Desulfobacteraceae bacterium]|nr:MAG: FAD-binding oxidoreductase [Desulfobacteraceae bacterium]